MKDLKQEIIDMRRQNMTYQQIGDIVGLSRQRVQVIATRELKFGEISLKDDLYFLVNNCFCDQEQGITYVRRVYNTLKKAQINTITDVVAHKEKIDGVSARQWKKLWQYAVANQ